MARQRDIGILYNPRAGRQRASLIKEKVSVYFASKGLRVRVRESSRSYIDSDLSDFLDSLDALVIVGGDGTLRPLLPRLAAARVPVVLFAAGNESLVSKQFAVPANIPDLFERVANRHLEEHYFAYLESGSQVEPFFLMAGLGFDAEVVKNVCSARTGGSSNFSYFVAGVKSLFSYRCPMGEIDFSFGKVPGSSRAPVSGPVIVGNSPCYGGSFQPVVEANSRRKEFAVRIFEEDLSTTIANWTISALRRKGISLKNSKIFYPEKIEVALDSAYPLQVDGDFIGNISKLTIRKSGDTVLFLV